MNFINHLKKIMACSFLLASPSYAQYELLTPQLFEVMVYGINASGGTVTDIAWPGYRIMDANGFLSMMGDVMGPYSSSSSYSVPNVILWSQYPYLKPQIRYDDFGGTCDYNNPSFNFSNQVRTPLYAPGNVNERRPGINSANGLQDLFYQSGTFNTCDDNPQFTKENFAPVPLITRFAWVYRSCKMLSVRTSSEQISRFVNRIRTPDPVFSNSSGTTAIINNIEIKPNDNLPPQNYNWCNQISYPTPDDYQKLFRAFYPGRTIPKTVSYDGNQNQAKTMGSGGSGTTVKSVNPGNLSLIGTHPRYYERLVELVNESDAYIATLTQNELSSLESNCNGSTNSGTPTLANIKAINAWRALLMISCMDPGPQVF